MVDNYKSINAAAQVEDPDSIFRWYRTLIALRKQYKVISEGRIQMLMPDDDALLAYRRWTDDEELLVVCNLTADTAPVTLPEGWQEARRLLGNYPAANLSALRPYECVVLYRKTRD